MLAVDEGLIFSYPLHVDSNHHISVVPHFDLSDSFSQEKFKTVLEELRQERDIVKSLGLIK